MGQDFLYIKLLILVSLSFLVFYDILCLGEKDSGDGNGAASEADGTRAIHHADTQSLALLAPCSKDSS